MYLLNTVNNNAFGDDIAVHSLWKKGCKLHKFVLQVFSTESKEQH